MTRGSSLEYNKNKYMKRPNITTSYMGKKQRKTNDALMTL